MNRPKPKLKLKSTDLVRVYSQEDMVGEYKYYNHINSDSDSPIYVYEPDQVDEEGDPQLLEREEGTQPILYYQQAPDIELLQYPAIESPAPVYVAASESESTVDEEGPPLVLYQGSEQSGVSSHEDDSTEDGTAMISDSCSVDDPSREQCEQHNELSSSSQAEEMDEKERYSEISESDLMWDSPVRPVKQNQRRVLLETPTSPSVTPRVPPPARPRANDVPPGFDPTRPPPPIDRSAIFRRCIAEVTRQPGINKPLSNGRLAGNRPVPIVKTATIDGEPLRHNQIGHQNRQLDNQSFSQAYNQRDMFQRKSKIPSHSIQQQASQRTNQSSDSRTQKQNHQVSNNHSTPQSTQLSRRASLHSNGDCQEFITRSESPQLKPTPEKRKPDFGSRRPPSIKWASGYSSHGQQQTTSPQNQGYFDDENGSKRTKIDRSAWNNHSQPDERRNSQSNGNRWPRNQIETEWPRQQAVQPPQQSEEDWSIEQHPSKQHNNITYKSQPDTYNQIFQNSTPSQNLHATHRRTAILGDRCDIDYRTANTENKFIGPVKPDTPSSDRSRKVDLSTPVSSGTVDPCSPEMSRTVDPSSPELWAQPTTENYGEFSIKLPDDDVSRNESTPKLPHSCSVSQRRSYKSSTPAELDRSDSVGGNISAVEKLCDSSWPSLNTTPSTAANNQSFTSSPASEGENSTKLNTSYDSYRQKATPKIRFTLAPRQKLHDISMPVMNTTTKQASGTTDGANGGGDCDSPSRLADKQRKPRWSLPGNTTSGSTVTGSPKFTRGLYLPGKDDSPGRSFGENRSWSSKSDLYDDSEWITQYKEKYFVSDVPFIDSHCHLDFLFKRKNHAGSLHTYMYAGGDKIATQTTPPNFAGCLAIFCDPVFWNQEWRWKKMLEEENIWGSFGCHPKSVPHWSPLAEYRMREALKHDKVMAVGEIGLDYSKGQESYKEKQKEAFIAQIKIAVEHRLPLVIHCRDAEQDCWDIMEEHVPVDHKIHRHCFTEDWQTACRWFGRYKNLMIGLTPLVTFPTARPTHGVARNVCLDRLLLETDCPYFIPRGVPRDRVPHSHPAMAITVAVEVARLRNCPVDTVLQAARENTRFMYNI